MEDKTLRTTRAAVFLVFWASGVVMVVFGLALFWWLEELSWLLYNPISLGGYVFLMTAIALYPKLRKTRRELALLKEDGLRYEADISGIVPPYKTMVVTTGFSSSGILECVYENGDGQRLVVKSKQHMLKAADTKQNLTAMVYVDKNNAENYAIEVLRRD